jgi:hypothetical protein
MYKSTLPIFAGFVLCGCAAQYQRPTTQPALSRATDVQALDNEYAADVQGIISRNRSVELIGTAPFINAADDAVVAAESAAVNNASCVGAAIAVAQKKLADLEFAVCFYSVPAAAPTPPMPWRHLKRLVST